MQRQSGPTITERCKYFGFDDIPGELMHIPHWFSSLVSTDSLGSKMGKQRAKKPPS